MQVYSSGSVGQSESQEQNLNTIEKNSKGSAACFQQHVPRSMGFAKEKTADETAEPKSARQYFFGGGDAEATSTEATVSKLIDLALQNLKEGRPEFAKSLIRAALALAGNSPDDFEDTQVEQHLKKALKKDECNTALEHLEKAADQLQQKAEKSHGQPRGIRDAEPVGLAEDALYFVLCEILDDETASEDDDSLQYLLSIAKLALDSLQEAYSPYVDDPGPVGDHAREAIDDIDRFLHQLDRAEPGQDQLGDLIQEIAERFNLNVDGGEAPEDTTSENRDPSEAGARATRDSDIVEAAADLLQTAIDATNDFLSKPQSSDAQAVLDVVVMALFSLLKAYGEAHDSSNSEAARNDIQGFIDRALDIASLGEPEVMLAQLLGLISDTAERFDLAPKEKEEA